MNIDHPSPYRLKVRRIIRSFSAAGFVQNAVAMATVALYFTGRSILILPMLVALLLSVVIGNFMLMRRTWAIISAERQIEEMEDALEGETELNRRLRSQRHDFMNHLQVVHALMELGEHAEAGEYIERVYTDIRSVSKLLRTEEPAVNAMLAAKAVAAENRGVALEFDIRSRVNALPIEPWQLCSILGNLLDNALDAVAPTAAARIRVRLWETLREFHFAVENNGPLIDEDLQERIFEPGFTTKGERTPGWSHLPDAARPGNQGMGLHIVRETLVACDGKIELHQGGGWVSFQGWLPLTKETSDR